MLWMLVGASALQFGFFLQDNGFNPISNTLLYQETDYKQGDKFACWYLHDEMDKPSYYLLDQQTRDVFEAFEKNCVEMPRP